MRLARSLGAAAVLAVAATTAALAQSPPAPPTPAPAAAPVASPTYAGFTTIINARTYAFVPAPDPQVFVADPKATGCRPARASDPSDTPLANANGDGIKTTLGAWLGAKGALILAPADTGTSVALSFSRLMPKGRYSLFEEHVAPGGETTSTPLDGTGMTNSFTASPDGTAKMTIVAPGRITHAEGISLIYHSDGLDHGTVRGRMGLDAHEQLVFRLP